MEEKDLKLLIWILIGFTLLVTAFAFYYFYYTLTFDYPEEIVINITEALG